MDITSIDHVTENDGLSLVVGYLDALNHPPMGTPLRRLVAIIPEYDARGIMQRLDCVTVLASAPFEGPTSAEAEIREGAAQITAERRRQHAAAIAKLDAETITITTTKEHP
jgi:hypothetical protein